VPLLYAHCLATDPEATSPAPSRTMPVPRLVIECRPSPRWVIFHCWLAEPFQAAYRTVEPLAVGPQPSATMPLVRLTSL
jgi:hypothetical protein